MSELPEGISLPSVGSPVIRPSASVMLSREAKGGHEILLGHRVSELPSFPDFWSFPGGGVSGVDREVSKDHPDWLMVDEKYRTATFALLREMAEEVGLSPDGKGGIVSIDEDTRERVCADKREWRKSVESGNISIENFHCEMITDRTTPPFAPMGFQNFFFHVPTGLPGVIPTFPPGRSEFDEFKWWKPQELLSAWEGNLLRIPPPIVTLLRDIVERIGDEGDLQAACDSLSADPPNGDHRIEFAPGVEVIPLKTDTLPPSTHTNCYMIGEPGGEVIIVDPAAKSEESLNYLKAKISESISPGSRIVASVFTHRHPDHIGDLTKISEIYQAPIWASEETLGAISADVDVSKLEEGATIELNGPSGVSTWEVIETPGHCPGHICLVGEAGIVSGDNCVVVGTILVPSSDGDMDAYISGLKRIRDLAPPMLFPGHGPASPNPRRLLDRYIRHRSSRHERVLNAVSSGISSLEDIARSAYEDTPDAHPLLSRDQTLSHLRSLVSSGKVEARDNGYYPV